MDGRKEVVAVVPGYRESVESWSEVLRDLRERGMPAPRLVIGDGHLGIWGGAAEHLAGGGRATVLEPQGPPCAGAGAAPPAGGG